MNIINLYLKELTGFELKYNNEALLSKEKILDMI